MQYAQKDADATGHVTINSGKGRFENMVEFAGAPISITLIIVVNIETATQHLELVK